MQQAIEAHEEALRSGRASLDAADDSTIDADALVVAAGPLHAQLVHCAAEHDAIEDTLFYLSKALSKKVIDLHDYLAVCPARVTVVYE